jgi:UDP-N-acetylmuramoyl-L-alanyl-D-glutamate--2,6-diaminopimelate ligase
VRFAAAIFTNLTQDHLDFHGTMEEYFQAKRRLFVPASSSAGGLDSSPAGGDGPGSSPGARVFPSHAATPPGVSVVNLDDPYGRRLVAELPKSVTFAIEHDAQYRAHDVRVGRDGCRLRLETPGGARALRLPLRGQFNVANALGALAAVHELGADLDTLAEALERGVRVPGRMEPVDEGQEYAVLVDYAHTPDSLENVLRTARELTSGRVICVFGAGGDRDTGKRALMGEIAARGADVVVVTSDNPRSEQPEAIIAQIVEGTAGARPLGAPKVAVEPDRREAIHRAVAAGGPGDVVVIAGKGHEHGQEFADGRVVAFDDVAVAREALRARRTQSAGAPA